MQGLMPINPVLWEGEAGRSPEGSGVRDQPAQHGETLSLLKIQKLARCSGVCLWSQLLRSRGLKNLLSLGGGGCSEQRSCHCTPAWVTRAKLCLKKKKEINILGLKTLQRIKPNFKQIGKKIVRLKTNS